MINAHVLKVGVAFVSAPSIAVDGKGNRFECS